MDCTIATTSELNSIPLFDDDTLRRLRPYLSAIGQVFVDHKMEGCWAAAYLHRHYSLDNSSTWVYHNNITLPQVIDPGKQYFARSYFLNDSGFRSYEFESSTPTRKQLQEPFLVSLRQFLKENRLEQHFAIVPKLDKPVLEALLDDSKGTMTYPCESLTDEEHITEWNFSRLNSCIIIQGQKKCEPLASGEHKWVK